MKEGKKAYIIGDNSLHGLEMRSMVFIDKLDEALGMAYCRKPIDGTKYNILLVDLTDTRPAKPMRVYVLGDRDGEIYRCFKKVGHLVKHDLFTDSTEDNLELLKNHFCRNADLVIVKPNLVADIETLYLATMSLKVRKVAFICSKKVRFKIPVPATQVFGNKICSKDNTSHYALWLKGLPKIPLHERYIGQTIPYELARRLALTWSQFTLRANTEF